MEQNEATVNDGLHEQEENHSNEGQGGQEFDFEKGYKELQSEFDKRNEQFYNSAEKLVSNNFDEIYSYDKKIQNKIVKKLYDYNSIDEYLIANEGSSETGDSDELTKIKAELKLMKYNEEQKVINKFIADNNINDGDAFREELWNISSKVALENRMVKAHKLLTNVTDKDVYLAWMKQGKQVSWDKVNPENTKKSEWFESEMMKIFSSIR